jgi:hypothetical protein
MEHSARPEIVLVFIDLPEGIADLQVVLIIIHPVLFAAVHSNATIRALKVHIRRRHVPPGSRSGITDG